MSKFKLPIALTNANTESMSRNQLLGWVNSKVNGSYQKIEHLCSGVAYCQMMEQLFPNCIGLKKIKMSPNLEHERLFNLRLLQNAFTRLEFDKSVPIDRLLKGRFQDNFEFLQWFHIFYNSQVDIAAKENVKNVSSGKGAKANANNSASSSKASGSNEKNPKNVVQPLKSLNGSNQQESLSVNRDPLMQGAVKFSPLRAQAFHRQINELKFQTTDIEYQRDYYLNKLKAVQSALNEAIEQKQDVEFCKKVLDILSKDDNTENGG